MSAGHKKDCVKNNKKEKPFGIPLHNRFFFFLVLVL